MNQKGDVWMMGCVIFTLMFFEHPFKESTKLTILNADFGFPNKNGHGLHSYPIQLEIILRNILNPDPIQRPSSSEVYKWFKHFSDPNKKNFNLRLDSKPTEIYLEGIKKLRLMTGGILKDRKWENVCRLFPFIPYKLLRKKFPQRFLDEMGIKNNKISKTKGKKLNN